MCLPGLAAVAMAFVWAQGANAQEVGTQGAYAQGAYAQGAGAPSTGGATLQGAAPVAPGPISQSPQVAAPQAIPEPAPVYGPPDQRDFPLTLEGIEGQGDFHALVEESVEPSVRRGRSQPGKLTPEAKKASGDDSVPAPAGGKIKIKDGGLELDFKNLENPLSEDDKIPLKVQVKPSGDVSVDVTIIEFGKKPAK